MYRYNRWMELGKDLQVKVDMKSPSFSRISTFPTNILEYTHAFNFGQLLASLQICEKRIFAESGRKNATFLVQTNAPSGMNWFYGLLRLESNLVRSFGCHFEGVSLWLKSNGASMLAAQETSKFLSMRSR